MFQQLLESHAVRQSHVGGSLVSMAGHAAAVLGLIVVTAGTSSPGPEPMVERPIYVASTPPAVSEIPTAARAVTAGAPMLPAEYPCGASCVSIAHVTVVEIPIGVPAIDFSHPVTSDLLARAGTPGRPIAAGTLSGNVGDAGPWSALQVDRPVFLKPGMPTPVFPDALRGAGISGTVMAEFVVDTLGRIEAASVQLVASDHVEFGTAVLQVLPRLRFIPAEAQGRKVRQLVRLPFRFDLHDVEGNANTGLMRS